MMVPLLPSKGWRVYGLLLVLSGCLHEQGALAEPLLDPKVYKEPSTDYWGGGADDGSLPKEIRRKTADLTREEFDKIVLDGKVLVVEDAGKDWPMEDWNCEFFRRDPTFSKAEMSQQYAAPGNGKQGYVPFTDSWLESKARSGAKDENAPELAPFYWGIKDVQYNDGPRSKTWKKSMLKKVREHIRLPPYMSPANLRSFNRTPEFWFAGQKAGAKAHMDTHVETTMSLQLAGSKRWRLSMMEPRTSSYLSFLYTDGDIYEGQPGGWKPVFNVTLRQGDALFFPPGFVHETLNVDSEPGACTASVTFQFDTPMPTRMYRRFFPRVRRTADIHEAWPRVAQWASLHRQPVRSKGLPYPKARAEALSANGTGATFVGLDTDSSNSLDRAELAAAFGAGEASNLLGFHDVDEDGVITRKEFAEVYGLWAGTVHAAIEETPKKYQQYHVKDMSTMNIEELPPKVQREMLIASREAELKLQTAAAASRSGHQQTEL